MLNPVENINTRCAALGVTVSAVLREAQVEWSNFSRWRAGETSPNMKSLQRIDNVLQQKEAANAPAKSA